MNNVFKNAKNSLKLRSGIQNMKRSLIHFNYSNKIFNDNNFSQLNYFSFRNNFLKYDRKYFTDKKPQKEGKDEDKKVEEKKDTEDEKKEKPPKGFEKFHRKENKDDQNDNDENNKSNSY
jgi:hypothetical protein